MKEIGRKCFRFVPGPTRQADRGGMGKECFSRDVFGSLKYGFSFQRGELTVQPAEGYTASTIDQEVAHGLGALAAGLVFLLHFWPMAAFQNCDVVAAPGLL